jgi:hypothetical protein
MKDSLTEIPGALILISTDLSDLRTSSVELMEGLKSGAPVSLYFATYSRPHQLNLPSKFQDNLKAKAQGLEDRVKIAFRKADNAYSVDPGF